MQTTFVGCSLCDSHGGYMCARRVPDSCAYSRPKENTVRRFADDLLWQVVTVRTLHENKETTKENADRNICVHFSVWIALKLDENKIIVK